MKVFKALKLLERLAKTSPEAELVRRGSDHSYIPVHGMGADDAEQADGTLSEWYDGHSDGKKVSVVVIE